MKSSLLVRIVPFLVGFLVLGALAFYLFQSGQLDFLLPHREVAPEPFPSPSPTPLVESNATPAPSVTPMPTPEYSPTPTDTNLPVVTPTPKLNLRSIEKSLLPAQIHVLRPIEFDVVFNGRPSGKVTAQTGSEVQLIEISTTGQLLVKYGASQPKLISEDWTDAIALAQARVEKVRMLRESLEAKNAASRVTKTVEPKAAEPIASPTPEAIPTSINERAKVTYYVEPETPGKGVGQGTRGNPFNGLEIAMREVESVYLGGENVRLILTPGNYRECARSFLSEISMKENSLVVEAEKPGQSIISGSDVWKKNWRELAGEKGVWVHDGLGIGWIRNPVRDSRPDWVANIEVDPSLRELLGDHLFDRRSDSVFVDGKPSMPVFKRSDLKPGTYFSDDETNKIFLALDPGDEPARHLIEVTVRPSDVSGPGASPLFQLRGYSNVVLRGITFKHCAYVLNKPACEILDGSNILVEDCEFLDNNGYGLGIDRWRGNRADRVTVRRVSACGNGMGGISGSPRNALFEDIRTDNNCWRASLTGWSGWDTQGIKLGLARDVKFRNFVACGNVGTGIWFDTDCSGILLENCMASQNAKAGFYIEKCQGPVTLIRCLSIANGTGFNGNGSSRVTLEDSVFINNSFAQIDPGARKSENETNSDTGEVLDLIPKEWTIRRCGFGSMSASAETPILDTFGGWGFKPVGPVESLDIFYETLKAEGNVFFLHHQAGAAFRMADGTLGGLSAWKRSAKDPDAEWSEKKLQEKLSALQSP